MPVWKFPQIYVDFTATVVPLEIGFSGYAAYGIVQPVYGELTLPAFNAEGAYAAIGQVDFPAFDAEGECFKLSAIFGEITSPTFNLEGTFGLIGEAQVPAFQSEIVVAAGATLNGVVAMSPIKAESDVSVENLTSGEMTLGPLDCEAWTGAIAEGSFPTFSCQGGGLSGTVASCEFSISGIAIESNITATQSMAGEASFSAMSAEGQFGSVAMAETPAWTVESVITALKMAEGQLTLAAFSAEGEGFTIAPFDGSMTLPVFKAQGLITGYSYETVVFGMHKEFF